MENIKDIQNGDLDEAVHMAASAMASNANNGGVEEQVEFLKSCGMSEEEILESAKNNQ